MEKNKVENIENLKSNMILDSRKKLALTGVIEVVRFNEEEIILNTSLGGLSIKGEELKMQKLDVEEGEVAIIGKINACIYTTERIKKKKKNSDSIISRLFR